MMNNDITKKIMLGECLIPYPQNNNSKAAMYLVQILTIK